MANEHARIDATLRDRAGKVAEAMRKEGVPGRWGRADTLNATIAHGLAQLELALGLRAPAHGEKLDPYWARFRP